VNARESHKSRPIMNSNALKKLPWLAVWLLCLAGGPLWAANVYMTDVCVYGGTSGGVMAAAAIGLAMPYLLRLMQRDPQVAAGPIALAFADMVTLLIYFNLELRSIGITRIA